MLHKTYTYLTEFWSTIQHQFIFSTLKGGTRNGETSFVGLVLPAGGSKGLSGGYCHRKFTVAV